jgi:hypothetical protein
MSLLEQGETQQLITTSPAHYTATGCTRQATNYDITKEQKFLQSLRAKEIDPTQHFGVFFYF